MENTSGTTTPLRDGPVLVELNNVTRHFGSFTALDSISLTIRGGEVTALMGENGAGKTTTLRLINGILRPSNGLVRIHLAGQMFDSVRDSNQVKAMTGLLPESGGMYNRLTATEYLHFIGSLYRLPSNQVQEHADHFFELLSFDRRSTALEDLSRGMRQKVLLTAALVNDPRVVLLDEPLATLDPSVSFRVKKLVREMRQDRVVLVASHSSAFVEEVADRVVLMARGKVLLEGTPASVVAQMEVSNLEEAYLRAMEHL